MSKFALSKGQRRALKEAAEWFTLLSDQDVGPDMNLRQDWERWMVADDDHRWAWQRIDRMQNQLQKTQGGLATSTLELAHRQQHERRAILKGIACVAALGGVGLGVQRYPAFQADYVTRTGEIKTHILSDQTQLVLNSASLLNVSFDDQTRKIVLLKGEVMVTSGHPQAETRPLVVETVHGRVRALGTRFAVSVADDATRLQVFEDRVELAMGQELSRWEAGQQVEFAHSRILFQRDVPANSDSWIKGMLVVNDEPLDRFLHTLSNYRHGFVSIDPGLSRYHISGAFRLDNTDQALQAVGKSFPVEVSYITPYWVRVRPRKQ